MNKKFNTMEEAMEAVNKLPMNVILELAAESLLKKSPLQESKIVVTEEQMAQITSMFKIKGIAEDGSPEKRGRKRLLKTVD